MAAINYWDEAWKPVKFDGINEQERYEISNYGRIRIYKKETNDWKILKPANVNGYQYFSFKSNIDWKHRKTKCVHRLVAELFLNRPSENYDNVIHLDFNKWNNYFKNLKWATREELLVHSQLSPRTKIAQEKRKGTITNAKLTESQVMRLKMKLKRGKNPLYKIAKEFGITHTQLNRIRRGENWGHVKID
ncbi:MAG: HNH endonuclease [Bacteroidales bacterium]|nr:HNH endonuclease [Bacteroidales bacterium]